MAAHLFLIALFNENTTCVRTQKSQRAFTHTVAFIMETHILLLCCTALLLPTYVLGEDVTYLESIRVENPYMDHNPSGEWGYEEYCSSGHAFAFDMKYEEPGAVDQTAVNAMKLFCKDSNGFTGEITSFEGNYGDWQGMRSCPDENDRINGFRLRIWPYQGTFGDDWAADNIQVICSNSNTTLDGFGGNTTEEQRAENTIELPTSGKSISEHSEVIDVSIKTEDLIHGDWTNWAHCTDGYYVKGLETFIDQGHPFADDAGLIDIVLRCDNM